jgi:TonB-dependent receptor
MKNDDLYRKPLTTAVALALGAFVAVPSMAQDATDDDAEEPLVLETVEVTGVRASLLRSMDRKRESQGVVDAIVAEDIGKFPDQNLAEALQRITGVSIQRTNNEGSQITVRGFGPEFNLVTLNGRTMPTQGGRSFDFLDISSSGIQAVEVMKTARADMPTGGIGATVNLITRRPMDAKDLRAFVTAKAVYESSAGDSTLAGLDEITPEVAGLYSNTFFDDTIGIQVSASYEKRNNREEYATVARWNQNYGLDGGTVENNNQRADGVWWHPQNADYGFAEITRERTNAQGVFQWAPTDTFTATVDYTYSELDFERDANSFGIWFANPNVRAVVNERGTVTSVTQSGGDYAANVARDHTIKENNSLGLNLNWEPTDTLSFNLDAHSSDSTLKGAGLGDGVPGSSANLIVGNTFCDWCGSVPGAGPFTATIDEKTANYFGSGIPLWGATFRSTGPDGAPQDFLLRSDIGSLFGQAFDVDNENDITQIQLKGTWTNESGESGLASIDFGLSWTDQEFVNRNAQSGLLPAGFWLTSAQYWDDDEWELRDFAGLLSDFSNSGNFPVSQYYLLPFGRVVDVYETIDASGDPVGTGVYWPGWPAFAQGDGRGFFNSGPLGNASGSGITEEIGALYFQFNFDGDFNGLFYKTSVGMRYENTKVISTGDEVPATAVIWVGGDEFVTEYGESTFITQSESNQEFLPNVDFSLEFTEDIVGRVSYSRTLARPPIGALSPVRGFTANPNIGIRNVSAGNPALKPYISDNFDLSLEWYYGEASYASIGAFYKQVDNFLVTTVRQEAFPDILDPYIGAQAELAREQLLNEGIPATNANVFARINENLGVAPTTPVRAEPGDPPVVWDVTTTDNAETGKLYGLELAVQHFFGDSGFGIQANATLVDGDVTVDRDVVGVQFALPGLSDSANLIGIFENEWISARLAYNWRDEFLAGFDAESSPVFVEEYGQFDLNVTWFATERLNVFLEGLNITEETQRSYVRYPEQFLSGNQYGSRWNLGATYRFN